MRTLLAVAALTFGAVARGDEPTPQKVATSKRRVGALEYSAPKTYLLTISLQVQAPRAATLRSVIATCPAPVEWPEQQVKLVSEHKPPGSSARLTHFSGIGAILTFRVPTVAAGTVATLQRTYRITRWRIRYVGAGKGLKAPAKIPVALRESLKAGPGVETADRKIANLSKQLIAGSDGWQDARASFDWIRKNVKYVQGNFRGAKATLAARQGDCEDMTALFVACCRAARLPARTVWIEGHAYPEFYLVDAKGAGSWIPAQLAGPEWFGEMAEYRPILQKGDRVYDSLRRRWSHYLPQSARALGGRAGLGVTFRYQPVSKPTPGGSQPKGQPR